MHYKLSKRDIPNMISLFRLACIGVLVWMFALDKILVAFFCYGVAMASDLLDGYLARKYHWITDLGKLLDPFADKLLQIVTLACFWVKGYLTWVPFAIITGKELVMILGGLLLLKDRQTVVYSNWFGKAAAAFFFLAMVATFFCQLDFVRPWYGIFMRVAMVVSVAAMVQYALWNAVLPLIREKKEKQARKIDPPGEQ